MRSRQIARFNRFRTTPGSESTELAENTLRYTMPNFDEVVTFPRVGLTRFLRDFGVRLVIEMQYLSYTYPRGTSAYV
jgi:hypothetical protein